MLANTEVQKGPKTVRTVKRTLQWFSMQSQNGNCTVNVFFGAYLKGDKYTDSSIYTFEILTLYCTNSSLHIVFRDIT